jgi:hypothetical protein
MLCRTKPSSGKDVSQNINSAKHNKTLLRLSNFKQTPRFPITMVSTLSARLLAGLGDSRSYSSKDTRSSQQKRTLSGAMKGGKACNISKKEGSLSGYSADKEGPAVLPPMVSIDLLGRGDQQSQLSRDAVNCPKRRKIVETQFAAANVKADLARAGIEFKATEVDIEKRDCSGGICIDLKGVRLIHSSHQGEAPLVTSRVSERTSVSDYESLIHAVSGWYPPVTRRMNHMPSFESDTPAESSSDRSTSSVSDTESDSGSDNINSPNNHILFLPPLVEDSIDQAKIQSHSSSISISPCNVISSASNAVTMAEMLQLSSSAR